MTGHKRKKLRKREEVDQKHRIKRKKPEPSSDQLHTFKEDTSLATKTPFKPKVDEHAALLAQARSEEERTSQLLHLQRTYGNKYVESLLNSAAIQTRLGTNPPEDVYEPKMGYLSQIAAAEPIEEEEMVAEDRAAAAEPIEEEEMVAEDRAAAAEPIEEEEMVAEDRVVAAEPVEEEEMMVEDRGTITQQTIHYPEGIRTDRKQPPVLVPVDPSRAGACVIVKDKKFDAWYNPTQPKCILGGMKIHEEKHISDFQADPNYKDIPTKGLTWEGPVKGPVPDGETFYYRNSADAKKFEHPAIDLEIAWLNEELKDIYELPESDRKIITERATKTLPEYKKSFG